MNVSIQSGAAPAHLRKTLAQARSLGRAHFEHPGFNQPPGVLIHQAADEFEAKLGMRPEDGHRMLWAAILLRAHEIRESAPST